MAESESARLVPAADAQVLPHAATDFVATLDLAMSGTSPLGWRLASGYVRTLDQYLGYVFTSRAETAEEWWKRTGLPGEPVRQAGRTRQFKIISGFAEHDERLGATATTVVQRETEPTRYEAQELIWPVIDEITADALGPGDWHPSMNWLDVIELLGEPDR